MGKIRAHRIPALDALRGIAALSVVFGHVHGVFFAHHIFLDVTPLRMLWGGGEAVVFFFVLSGFVLSGPYCQTGQVPYRQFLIARFTRIYLPYLAAIAACLVLSIILYNPAVASAHHFLGNRWPHPIDWRLLASHVLLIGNFNSAAYDEVIWSLIHEMRFALVFPAFIWIVRRLTWKQCLILCASASICAGLATAANIDPSIGFKNSYLYSVHYLLFFAIGALIVRNIKCLGERYSAMSRRLKTLLLCVAIGAYMYSSLLGAFLKGMGWIALSRVGDFIGDWGVGLAAAIFMVLAVHSRTISSVLTHRSFLLLGKISFSLYLVHVPVFAAALYLFHSESVAVLAGLPFVFLAAVIFHKAVEEPSHRLGRRLFQGNRALVLVAEGG